VETTSAQIATLPIIALMFGKYSLLALPANLLVLPFVPLAMVLTFVAGIFWVFMPTLHVTAIPAEILLSYMIYVVNWLASLPGAQGEINFTAITFIVSYIAIILLGLFLWRKTKHNFREDNIVE
ncbi:ComEC/Rec2 family competence protein, partial [Candidatus Saccharibacteria bacterium]|nr:ComEC/Rec2 family competence protein [Candidatus Saccharibacteria bacterium]